MRSRSTLKKRRSRLSRRIAGHLLWSGIAQEGPRGTRGEAFLRARPVERLETYEHCRAAIPRTIRPRPTRIGMACTTTGSSRWVLNATASQPRPRASRAIFRRPPVTSPATGCPSFTPGSNVDPEISRFSIWAPMCHRPGRPEAYFTSCSRFLVFRQTHLITACM